MRFRTCIVLLVLCMLATGRVWGQTARFAVVVGNNRGQDRGASLKYAERDARRFARLLSDLGGFDPGDVILLTGGSDADFIEALSKTSRRIESRVPARIPRALLVVFFSGHADGINLEIGSDLLPYSRLRELLESSPAQVKIAFIDSCQSGGLVASKGGRPGPGFDLVLTDNIDADGTAIVTSSSAGENSQESGEIMGSFFTHYLLSGLRGAADHDQDRRVTLAEVYQYTYDKTVVETSRTLAGTQHPTYEYEITGRGKVVLTDLSRSEARLSFGPDLAGEFLVLRSGNQEVLAELSKAYGGWRHLALPAGDYRIAQRRNQRLFSRELSLSPGSRMRLDPAELREQGSLMASAKQAGSRGSGLGVFVHYGLMSGALKSFAAVHQGALGLRLDLGPTSLFPKLAYGEANIEDSALSYHIRLLSLESYFTWRFEYSVLDIFAGIKLGLSFGSQRLPALGGFEQQDHSGTIFSYGAVGGIDLPLYRGLALHVFWEAGSEVFQIDRNISQHVSLKGVVGIAYQF